MREPFNLVLGFQKLFLLPILVVGPFFVSAQQVHFDASGTNGSNGRHGTSYNSSSGAGSGRGRNGGDAGPSSPGESAGSIQLQLEDQGDSPQGARLLIRSRVITSRGQQQNDEKKWTITPSGPRIKATAKGGDGGDGGRGGDGEGGDNGRDGRDATRSSSGTNGSSGYDGGNGGDGTPGSNGGSGGTVVLSLNESDLHLAFLLESYEVSGGAGGAAGSNGSGGSGGSGGRGGSSYSWREKVGTRQVKSNNADGSVSIRSEDVMAPRSNPGGSSGSSGSRGRSGNGRVSAGQSGRDGRFEFKVTDSSGRQKSYATVSQLRVLRYSIQDENADGIIEPREKISISSIVVKNNGGMPSTSGKAEVLFRLPQAPWAILPTKDIVIPALQPGQTYEVPVAYDFQIRDLIPEGKNERWNYSASVAPQGRVTRVYYDYPQFAESKVINITVPLEISELKIPETMAPGERSPVSFVVKNISTKSLGIDSDSKRVIEIALSQTTQQDKPFAFSRNGMRVELNHSYLEKIARLSPQESLVVEGVIQVPSQIEPYSSVHFSHQIGLQPIRDSQTPQIIQRNETDLRIGARYAYTPGADMLLVVNHNTEKAEVEAWLELAKSLGLKIDIWDASYYGYLHLKKQLDDQGSTLMNNYAGKTVVVLNNKSDRQKLAMGSDALDAQEFIDAASRKLMNFYVIGGSGGTDFLQWLMTSDPAPLSQSEGSEGLEKYKFADSSVIQTVPQLKHDKRSWAKSARRLSQSLYEKYPGQRFVLECPTNAATSDLSQIVVRATIDPARGRASYHSQPEEVVHSREFILSEENLRGLILNLPFHKKLSMLRQVYSGKSLPREGADEVLRQALVHDIIEEIETRRRVDAKSHNDSQVARQFQLFMGYMKTQVRMDDHTSDVAVESLTRTLAELSFYIDHMPGSGPWALEDNLAKDMKKWKQESWNEVFGSQASKAESAYDKHTEILEDQLKERRKVLVGIDDVEAVRHMLIYPAKREVKTTDEILRDGNKVVGP